MGAAVSITRLDLTASELRKAASRLQPTPPARLIPFQLPLSPSVVFAIQPLDVAV